MQQKAIEVGRVKALYRYPVKSMSGEALSEADVWWHGLDGDRKYAFVQSDNRSGFPWLTGRQIPTLLRYQPYFSNPNDPANSPVRVKTPKGDDFLLESDALHQEIGQLTRLNFHLMKLGRGAVDSMPVSMISTASIEKIGQQIGHTDLDPRRFRANVLIESFEGTPFLEEQWLGSRLIFGTREDSVRLHANRQNVRCMMINLDPDTAKQSPAILREVVESRDQCAGIYGSIVKPGTIKVGDVISLLKN